MPKYYLRLDNYELPDSIKEYNKQVKLNVTEYDRNKVKNELDKVNKQLEDEMNKDEDIKDEALIVELNNEKERLNNKLIEMDNTISNIKAEIYNSSKNPISTNINELKKNLFDISKIIKGSPKFNKETIDNINKILKSQVKLNSIFDATNFSNLLQDILNKVNNINKVNYQDEFNNIKNVLQDIKNNPRNEFENQEIWEKIKDDIKKLIPDDLQLILKEYSNSIREINKLKSELNKLIFNKYEVDNDKINDYILKSSYLYYLYYLVENNLNNKYLNNNGATGFNVIFSFDKNDYIQTINNIRKWFTDNYKEPTKFDFNKQFITNMNISNILKDSFVNNIEFNDILKTVNIIRELINKKDKISNNPYSKSDHSFIPNDIKEKYDKKYKIPNDDDYTNEMSNYSEGLNKSCYSKGLSKQSSSGDLDLDEIHNMNIMNNIINSMNRVNTGLDNIIYNQKIIINLLQNNKSNIKLGRFKVEKYNPNMSITEFKKLFNTQP